MKSCEVGNWQLRSRQKLEALAILIDGAAVVPGRGAPSRGSNCFFIARTLPNQAGGFAFAGNPFSSYRVYHLQRPTF